jgi:hypothetical protein
VSTDWQDTLDGWERTLRDLLPGVTLLGELDLSDRDRDQIAAALHAGIAALGAARFTRKAEAAWPVTVATYLVSESTVSYRKGEFWPAVCERTGLPRANYPARWGRIVERALEIAGKPTFADLVKQENATRYLARILAHGGIPNACLPDLFARVLAPATRRRVIPQAAELLDGWRTQPQPLRGVDRPVRRFLMEGGNISRDFLNRCLELARRTKVDGQVPQEANQVGLPVRVVGQYRTWWEARRSRPRRSRAPGTPPPAPARRPRPRRPRGTPRPANVRPRSSKSADDRVQKTVKGSSTSFVAPYLALEPWGQGVLIRLPAQRLTSQSASSQARWTIFDGAEERSIPQQLWKRGKEYVCDADEIRVERVSQTYRVCLTLGDELEKKWELGGMPADTPVLAFRTGGRMRAWTGGIPATEVWVLVPWKADLAVMRAGSDQGMPLTPLEEGPPLWGDWEPYRVLRLDLRDARALALRWADRAPISVPLLTPVREPELIGKPVLAGEQDEDGVPVYGTLPAVRIPLDPLRPAAKQIERYSLTLRHAGKTAQSTTSRAVSLAELHAVAVDGPDSVVIPLIGLIDPAAAGEFELSVRLELGRDATLRFAVLPGLEVRGHDRVVLPSQDGRPQPAPVRVYCPAGGRLEVDGEGVKVHRESSVHGSGVWWQVEGPPELNAIPLRFERRDAGGAKQSVAFRVPVQRLAWQMEGLDLPPSNGGLRCVRDKFADAVRPCLTVRTPPAGDLVGLRLALLTASDTASGQLRQTLDAPKGWKPGQGRELRFDLAALRDTVRHEREPELTLALDVRLGEADAPPTRFPILRIECPPLPEVDEADEEPAATVPPPDVGDRPQGSAEGRRRALDGSASSDRAATPVPTPPAVAGAEPITKPPGAPPLPMPGDGPAPAPVLPEMAPPSITQQRPGADRQGGTVARALRPAPVPITAKVTVKPPPDHLIGERYADVPEPKDLRAPSPSPSDRGPLYICVHGRSWAIYEPACPTCSDVGQSNQAWRSDHDPATIVFSKCLHTVQDRDVRVGRRLKP